MIDTYAQSFGNASHVEDCGASCTVMEAIQYFPELCPLPDDDLNSCWACGGNNTVSSRTVTTSYAFVGYWTWEMADLLNRYSFIVLATAFARQCEVITAGTNFAMLVTMPEDKSLRWMQIWAKLVPLFTLDWGLKLEGLNDRIWLPRSSERPRFRTRQIITAFDAVISSVSVQSPEDASIDCDVLLIYQLDGKGLTVRKVPTSGDFHIEDLLTVPMEWTQFVLQYLPVDLEFQVFGRPTGPDRPGSWLTGTYIRICHKVIWARITGAKREVNEIQQSKSHFAWIEDFLKP